MLTVFHIPVKTGIDAINILDSITHNLGPHIPGIIASYTHMATTWKENRNLYIFFLSEGFLWNWMLIKLCIISRIPNVDSATKVVCFIISQPCKIIFISLQLWFYFRNYCRWTENSSNYNEDIGGNTYCIYGRVKAV